MIQWWVGLPIFLIVDNYYKGWSGVQPLCNLLTSCNKSIKSDGFIMVQSVSTYYIVQGVFFNWYPPKKYGKPRLGESTAT